VTEDSFIEGWCPSIRHPEKGLRELADQLHGEPSLLQLVGETFQVGALLFAVGHKSRSLETVEA
jgi:hypothetical protein